MQRNAISKGAEGAGGGGCVGTVAGEGLQSWYERPGKWSGGWGKGGGGLSQTTKGMFSRITSGGGQLRWGVTSVKISDFAENPFPGSRYEFVFWRAHISRHAEGNAKGCYMETLPPREWGEKAIRRGRKDGSWRGEWNNDMRWGGVEKGGTQKTMGRGNFVASTKHG